MIYLHDTLANYRLIKLKNLSGCLVFNYVIKTWLGVVVRRVLDGEVVQSLLHISCQSQLDPSR